MIGELAIRQKGPKLHGEHARGNLGKLLQKVARECVQHIGRKVACSAFGEQRMCRFDKWQKQFFERQRIVRHQIGEFRCRLRRGGGVLQSRCRFQDAV